jgi:hypothetical protein
VANAGSAAANRGSAATDEGIVMTNEGSATLDEGSALANQGSPAIPQGRRFTALAGAGVKNDLVTSPARVSISGSRPSSCPSSRPTSSDAAGQKRKRSMARTSEVPRFSVTSLASCSKS